MIEIICQIFIPIVSAAGVFFVTRKDESRKWGFVLGLATQPFWFYTTLHNRQYGLFILSLFYTVQWIKGIINHFGKES